MKPILTTLFSLLILFCVGQSNTRENKNSETIRIYPLKLDKATLAALPIIGSTEKLDTTEYVIPVVFHILHEYGTEDITDAQIYDAMEILNREFNAEDPDSVDIIDQYKNLNADVNIRFKLAAIDPQGNCTNGIEHIYTHETRIGDMYSKLDQWDRSKYLNIWVSKTIDLTGLWLTAAYTLMPFETSGNNFWKDGVFINHAYTGSIGTASPFLETTLTSQVGNYLNLCNIWGCTAYSATCGDDGITDTPITQGFMYCPSDTNLAKVCDTIVEDYQNYMDVSFCQRHFTPGQADAMRSCMQSALADRNMLWQDPNLINTGVKDLLLPQIPTNDTSNLTVPLCPPIADFHSNRQIACTGATVIFKDYSWNAVIGSRVWTFEGGTPASSTAATENVFWTTPGYKKVILTVSNAAGTDTKIVENYIYISPDWPDLQSGPQTLDIEGNKHYLFVIQNPENNYGTFIPFDNAGYNGSRCFKLQNYKDVSQAATYSDDYFYNNRLGLSIDNLITPGFDLSNTTNITVKFKYAYSSNATDTSDVTEKLKVFTTINCGASWSPTVLYINGSPVGTTLTGSNLLTAGFAVNTDFNPTNNSMWKEASFNYNSISADVHTRFRFEFEASDFSNNLFIDQIEVTGILGLSDETTAHMELTVYPNPSEGEGISVTYHAQNEPVTFTLRDVQGKIIATQVIETTNTVVSTELENTANLPSACYFLEVSTGGSTMTKKVVVL